MFTTSVAVLICKSWRDPSESMQKLFDHPLVQDDVNAYYCTQLEQAPEPPERIYAVSPLPRNAPMLRYSKRFHKHMRLRETRPSTKANKRKRGSAGAHFGRVQSVPTQFLNYQIFTQALTMSTTKHQESGALRSASDTCCTRTSGNLNRTWRYMGKSAASRAFICCLSAAWSSSDTATFISASNPTSTGSSCSPHKKDRHGGSEGSQKNQEQCTTNETCEKTTTKRQRG